MKKFKEILLYLFPLYIYIGYLTISYYKNPEVHEILNWFDYIGVRTLLYFIQIMFFIKSLFI